MRCQAHCYDCIHTSTALNTCPLTINNGNIIIVEKEDTFIWGCEEDQPKEIFPKWGNGDSDMKKKKDWDEYVKAYEAIDDEYGKKLAISDDLYYKEKKVLDDIFDKAMEPFNIAKEHRERELRARYAKKIDVEFAKYIEKQPS